MSQPRARRLLALFLVTVGAIDLVALVPAMMPRATMSAIHAWWGLGPLPEGPIVGYLARSTSLLYAFRGTVMLHAAADVDGRRPLIALLAWTSLAFGLGLLAVDLHEGMPGSWTRGEWGTVVGTGVVLLVLLRCSGGARVNG